MVAYDTPVPRSALLAAALPSPAWSDAYAVESGLGWPDDPQAWLDAIMRHPPWWVVPVVGLRQGLALACGIRPAYRPRGSADHELVIPVDTGAFDCWVSLLCADGRVVVSTVGTPQDARGRLFLAVAGRAHPYVVRAALTKAAAVLGRARPCPVPSTALLTDALPRTDLVDAQAVPAGAGLPDDPMSWADAVFGDPPYWVAALLRLRESLVGLVGIERRRPGALDPVAVDDHEVVLGSDARHLDVRASVLRDPDRVVVTTVVQVHSVRGRLYLGVVRLVHPMIVRALLGRAAASLARSVVGDAQGISEEPA